MVVLDATIVNVALPHIQRALGFSGSGPEWVVNAYTLTFGGLLLLAGQAGTCSAGRNLKGDTSVPRVDARHLMLQVRRQPGTIHQAIGIAT